MPKYESDNDKKQREDAAAKHSKDTHQKGQDAIEKSRKDAREKAADTPGGHTNEDTASLLTPEEQAVQEAGNAELKALREKSHKGQLSVAELAKETRLNEQKARFEQRKAEMKRLDEETNNPPPQRPATNPSNVTSPATHIPIDVSINEGEP